MRVACQFTPVFIMSLPPLSSVNGQAKLFRAMQGRCQKHKISFPPLYLLPAVPGHSVFQTSPTHSSQHTHTHTSPVQGSLQPYHYPCLFCVHGPLFLQYTFLSYCGEEGKQPALIYHLDKTLKFLFYFSNLVFTPSCISLYWKLLHIKVKKQELFPMLQSRQRIVQLITYNSKPKQNVSFISEPQDIGLIESF